MRKVIFVVAVFTLATAPALADFGEIIYSWKAPWREGARATICKGLAWDGQYIWLNCDYSGKRPRIYRCLPSNGSVVSWFDSKFIVDRSGCGMNYRRWQGQPCLEIAVWDEYEKREYVYRLNYKGEIIGSFIVNLPGSGLDYVYSLAFDGTHYWVTDPESEGNSVVHKLTANGTAVGSFAIGQKGYARGIALQGDFFWASMDAGYEMFFGACKMKSTGSVVASFEYLQPDIYDCSYGGRNLLWLVRDRDTVLCVDVSNAPAVAPASVGRIKALFR